MANVKCFMEMEHELHNKETKVEVGNIFYNKEGETLVIVRKANSDETSGLYSKPRSDVWEIQFILTKNKQLALQNNIVNGRVKNCMTGSVFGVGIVNDVDIKKYSREYILWKSMLTRSYDNSWLSKYPWYRGVTVHPRWLSLENFITDTSSLPNYDKWKSGVGNYELDKDSLSPEGRKIYSKDTCMFLTKADNVKLAHRKVD